VPLEGMVRSPFSASPGTGPGAAGSCAVVPLQRDRSNHDRAGQSFRERERAPVALSSDPTRPWPLAHGIPMGAGSPYAKQSIDLAALA
jgi:hypothetical protein